MINKVKAFIEDNNIFNRRDSVILGVSGGADSMFMLHVLNELKDELELKLSVVHVNHNIRGNQAVEDSEFVRSVCANLGVDYKLVEVNIPEMVKETGMSEEEAGRTARYGIFADVMNEKKANKIAVAHNLNDNSETILFNLFRGAGIKGLTGIPIVRDNIVRPILCMTRKEIENYLSKNGISYREDATNSSTDYSRNKIRLDLIPEIKTNINEKAEYNIVNAAENLKEIWDFIEEEAKFAYSKYVKDDVITKEAFELHNAVFSQIVRMLIEKQAGKLKDITRVHIGEVMKLRDMEVSKSIDLPYELVAVKTYDGIAIKKRQETLPAMEEEILLKDGVLYSNKHIEIIKEKPDFNGENIPDLLYTKWIDYDRINELSLRNRKSGDYIVVDKKGSRKKLKDYFIDQKIPREDRDQLLLVADGEHIVWIVGYRISSHYMVNEETKNILKLTFK